MEKIKKNKEKKKPVGQQPHFSLSKMKDFSFLPGNWILENAL